MPKSYERFVFRAKTIMEIIFTELFAETKTNESCFNENAGNCLNTDGCHNGLNYFCK
jgi:hypothetical protein